MFFSQSTKKKPFNFFFFFTSFIYLSRHQTVAVLAEWWPSRGRTCRTSTVTMFKTKLVRASPDQLVLFRQSLAECHVPCLSDAVGIHLLTPCISFSHPSRPRNSEVPPCAISISDLRCFAYQITRNMSDLRWFSTRQVPRTPSGVPFTKTLLVQLVLIVLCALIVFFMLLSYYVYSYDLSHAHRGLGPLVLWQLLYCSC